MRWAIKNMHRYRCPAASICSAASTCYTMPVPWYALGCSGMFPKWINNLPHPTHFKTGPAMCWHGRAERPGGRQGTSHFNKSGRVQYGFNRPFVKNEQLLRFVPTCYDILGVMLLWYYCVMVLCYYGILAENCITILIHNNVQLLPK